MFLNLIFRRGTRAKGLIVMFMKLSKTYRCVPMTSETLKYNVYYSYTVLTCLTTTLKFNHWYLLYSGFVYRKNFLFGKLFHVHRLNPRELNCVFKTNPAVIKQRIIFHRNSFDARFITFRRFTDVVSHCCSFILCVWFSNQLRGKYI
jgi:hypothetical protein